MRSALPKGIKGKAWLRVLTIAGEWMSPKNSADDEALRTILPEFDAAYYRERHAGLKGSDEELARHYLVQGAAAGYDPAPTFSTRFYLAGNKDVARDGINPFVHYLNWGRVEGRPGSSEEAAAAPRYNDEERVVSAGLERDFYLSQADPMGERAIDPVKHYCAFGWHLGLNPAPGFSTEFYLRTNKDVAGKGVNPFFHYLVWGRHEGRRPKEEGISGRVRAAAKGRIGAAWEPFSREAIDPAVFEAVKAAFDPGYYRAKHPALKGSDDELVKHYLVEGARRLFDPSPSFSTKYYAENNEDVAEGPANPFYHYLQWGRFEGRSGTKAEALGHPDHSKAEKLVARHFDREFYLDQVDPERVRAIDPVKHYCVFGWRQGYDPVPAFSTAAYLAGNPDVAATDENPYIHYLTVGRIEARPAVPSARAAAALARAAGTARAFDAETGRPRVGVIAMVRNEGDIIALFARHLLALFDEIVLVDHRSDDVTRQIVQALAAAHPNVTRYELQEHGYIQDIVSNHVVRECEALKGVDWILFLDADEFLPFASKDALCDFLHRHSDFPVISLRWKNLIPAEYWDYKVGGLGEKEIFCAGKASKFRKIAFQPKKMEGLRYWINQGNHSISRAKGMDPLRAHESGAVLYHLPIRSANQLAIKLNQGVLSYLRRKTHAGDMKGQHWFEILNSLNSLGDITPELLNGVALSYGDVAQHGEPAGHDDLEEAGYRRQTIEIALADPASVPAVDHGKAEIARLMFRLGGTFATSAASDDENVVQHLETREGNVLVGAKGESPFRYLRLPPRSDAEKQALRSLFSTPARSIKALITDSYQEIRDLPPTAWAGHIPFMFTVASVLKPRRFVELGSHNGASFLAYCQASERMLFGTEAVAVDCWAGDEHAGFYDTNVFDKFKPLIAQYDSFAQYIRAYFDEAVLQFEDGSIDLLHIDGLHTYAAVAHDFQTWLPKLSSDGLILFHDINVHERDFGVWRLWDELRRKYPAAHFMHSHGLGVLYVGNEAGSGVEAMVKAMADPDVQDVLQVHFESVSQLSTGLAHRKRILREKEKELAALSEDAKNLNKVRQRNSYLESENRGLREKGR